MSAPGAASPSRPLAQWVDGRPAIGVDPQDRGLQYGDGLFETVAVADGRPRRWARHMARLRRGAERLSLPPPDEALLAAELRAQLDAAAVDRAVAKLVYTRGRGGRGYRPPNPARATRVLTLFPWPEYPPGFWAQGVRVRLCRTVLGSSPALAGLKHLNRLEQVLARAEWDAPDVPEGLMLDAAGMVVEATQSNLFAVESGRLLTPDLSASGVAGIMRELIIELAPELDIAVEVTPLSLQRVQNAEEVFLTNAVIGLWPVRELAGRPLAAPGPLTRRLSAASRDRE